MKRIITLFVFLTTTLFYAQNSGITYQAVLYNPSGEILPGNNNSNAVLSNKDICLRFSIKDATTNLEYQETQKVKTDEFGMVNLVVGKGNQVGGYASNFDAIVWNSSNKKLQVEIDVTGNCSSFIEISDQDFSAVPFAYASKTAENVSGIVAIANGGTGASTVVGAKTNLGLNNVDNTSDANKPISTATQAALDTKAPLASPALTGTPTVPTATIGTNTTQIASTAFVNSAIAAATTPDATETVKGKIKLIGDLGGTADAPTVPGLANKENTIAVGTTAQYYRGDKSWQTLDKMAVGLGNVSNTTDADKPVSIATQTALNAKENTIAAGTTAQYYRGDKSWQTLDKTAVGLGNVSNTTDADKPVSTATQTALDAKEAAANKSANPALGTSDDLFPTQKAVKTYVDNQISAGVVDASTSTKGKIQLAGDLGGTADAPSVPGLALKAPLNSPQFTGTPSLPTGTIAVTQAANDNSTAVATTAFVRNALSTSNSNARSSDLDMAGNSIANALAIRAGNFQMVDEVLHPFFGGNDPNSVTILNRNNNVTQFLDGRTGSPILAITNSVNEEDEFGTPTPEEGKIGIGTTTPSEKLQVIGNIKSQSFIKDNGTAGQFLKADGSVDANTYLTTTSATGTYEPIITAGTTAQYLRGDKTFQTLDKTAVGLGNVSNTADADKPVSTATQTALDAKEAAANKSANPALGTSDDLFPTQKAVKTYVDNQISAGVVDASTSTKGKIQLAGDLGGTADAPTVPGLANKENTITAGTTAQYYRGDKTFQTLDKAAVGLGNVSNTTDADKPVSNDTQAALNLKANLASPTFTGDAKAVTATTGDNDTSVATTAFVSTAITNAATPVATTSDLGKIQLGGDLAGTGSTAAAPVITAGAITATKLGNDAVEESKIKNGSVTTTKIADNAVTNAKLGGIVSVNKGGTGADMTATAGYVKQATTGANLSTVSTIPVADVTGAVSSVNGVTPVDGNVSVLLGRVFQGVNEDPTQASSIINVNTDANQLNDTKESDIYIIVGNSNSANNGRTFIFNGTNWIEVSTNLSTTDTRYVNVAGDTMAGDLTVPTGNKITIADAPTVSTDVANKAYVDTKVAVANNSGTTNFVPKFSGTSPSKILENSSIFDDGAKVGIGTSTPLSTLHINNPLMATDNINADAKVLTLSRPTTSNIKWDNIAQFNLGSYAVSTNNSDAAHTRLDLALNDGGSLTTSSVMTWQANGNVGIGTTSPISRFSNAPSGTNFVGSTNATQSSNGISWLTNSTGYNTSLYNAGTEAGSNGLQVKVANTSPQTIAFEVGQNANLNGTSTSLFNVLGNGNVGIGTNSPSTDLDVVGGFSLRNAVGAAGTNYGIEFNTNSTAPRIDWVFNGQYVGQFASDANDFLLKNSKPTTGGFSFVTADASSAGTVKVRIANNGNVGIGTSAPSGTFEVATTNGLSAIIRRGGTAGQTPANLILQKTSGLNAAVHGAVVNGDFVGRILFSASNGSSYLTNGTDIVGYAAGTQSATNNGGGIFFRTVPQNSVSQSIERLRIDENGNIGIGTTAPTAQLHTTGTVRFAGAGTPGAGKVLTSDADGNATWQSTSVNRQTANYTLTANDSKRVVIMDSTTDVTVTVPANTLSEGFFCQIIQKGTGKVTVEGVPGVTINSANGTKTRARYSSIGVLMESGTEGYISGDSEL